MFKVNNIDTRTTPCYYWLHDFFQLIHMQWKFQLGLFKAGWNFKSVNHDDIFAYIRNSIFILLSFNMRDEISSRFNKLKFQPGLKISTLSSHFHKRLPLTCLTGFCLWLCCVRDDNLSENFPTQPYMSLFLVFSGGSKFCLLQLFLFSMQLI